jgi:hypothetical protein
MNSLYDFIRIVISLLDNKLKSEITMGKEPKDKDVLLAELDLHKTEFSALRTEILQQIESERQYLNLSLVAFGVGIGLAPFLSNPKTYVILLLFPLVFHVLLWEMLKSVQLISMISNYLMNILIPRVNEILNLLGRENRNIDALGWELHINAQNKKVSKFIESSLTPTRHWIPVLAIGALVIAYLVIVQNAGYTPSIGELILVFVNLILLIWAAVQNVLTMRSVGTKARKTGM